VIASPARGATLADAAAALGLAARLPRFLRRTLTPERARAVLERRLRTREADVLACLDAATHASPPGPYRALLRATGSELGDAARLVREHGVEGALERLAKAGVYLTADELKGRRPVVRGSLSFTIDPRTLRNPRGRPDVPSGSSGSRGDGTTVGIDLAFVRDCAVDSCAVLAAERGERWVKAVWSVPGGMALFRVLEYAAFGVPTARWFSQLDPAAPGLHPRYRWSGRVLRWGSCLAGVPLPAPRLATVDDARPVLAWVAGVVRGGGTPYLHTFASAGVRLAQAALGAGVDLAGVHLTVGGEPLTPARLEAISRSGAMVRPRYGSVECGHLGFGCLAPAAPDDLHVAADLHAVIQAGAAGVPELPPRALLVTSLRPTSPFLLVNASLGDEAVLGTRPCGCPLEALGWARHMHGVRSFEKLTAAGMTFSDGDVVRVLEIVLPGRFGGGPTDYQMVEQEDAGGGSAVTLVVHPSVGPVDDAALREAFLAALGTGPSTRVMALAWREAGLPRVERRAPLPARSGKILHLLSGR
jgi:hypothetical protein